MKKEKHGNSMFLNKDGYAKSVEIEIPSQNIVQMQDINQVLEDRTILLQVIVQMLKELKLSEKKRNL